MTTLPRLYLANLFALVATGVLASGWLLFYTESFQVIGGLLGLGGLLAWAAFVAGLLTEESKKGVQALFEAQVLLRGRTMLACALVVIALGVLTSMSGTLILDAEADNSDRMVSVSSADSNAFASVRVPAHSVRRLWTFTPIGGKTLRVKAEGLPGIDVPLQPPFRTHLGLPSTFLGRRRLLVRPGRDHSGSAAREPRTYELLVRLGQKTDRIHPYAGQSVWVGTEDDVSIPQELVKRWRELLISTDVSATIVEAVLARWVTPASALSDAVLLDGQRATIEIRRVSDQYVIATKTVEVRRTKVGDAIQEVILE